MGTGETVHLILMIILTPLMVGVFSLVVVWFVRQRGDDRHSARVADIWLQREQWGEATCRRLIERQIEPGMRPEMVRLSWGEPGRISAGATETWHYPHTHSNQPESRVEFTNGQVSRVIGSPPAAGREINPWWLIAAILGVAFFLSAVTLVVIFTV